MNPDLSPRGLIDSAIYSFSFSSQQTDHWERVLNLTSPAGLHTLI